MTTKTNATWQPLDAVDLSRGKTDRPSHTECFYLLMSEEGCSFARHAAIYGGSGRPLLRWAARLAATFGGRLESLAAPEGKPEAERLRVVLPASTSEEALAALRPRGCPEKWLPYVEGRPAAKPKAKKAPAKAKAEPQAEAAASA